jgi:putative flavoprotein involved in K+ transport
VSVLQSPAELHLTEAGISTVIWATGYRPDLAWVGLPFLDGEGYPVQLGLDWFYTAASGIFAGLGDDAAYLTEHITGQPVES